MNTTETEVLDYIHLAAFEGLDAERTSGHVYRAITNATGAARAATGLAVLRINAVNTTRSLWVVLVIGQAPEADVDATIRRWLAQGTPAAVGAYFTEAQLATILTRRRRNQIASAMLGGVCVETNRGRETAPVIAPDGHISTPRRTE